MSLKVVTYSFNENPIESFASGCRFRSPIILFKSWTVYVDVH